MMQIRYERFVNHFTCIWNPREGSVYFCMGRERVAIDGLRTGALGFSVLRIWPIFGFGPKKL